MAWAFLNGEHDPINFGEHVVMQNLLEIFADWSMQLWNT